MNFNPEAVNKFCELSERIEKYVEKKGWDLPRQNNKRYVGFYNGHWIVFGLHFHSNDCFHIFFKITPEMINNREISGFKFKYGTRPKQVMYYFPASVEIKISLFDEHFEAAYKNRRGKKL